MSKEKGEGSQVTQYWGENVPCQSVATCWKETGILPVILLCQITLKNILQNNNLI